MSLSPTAAPSPSSPPLPPQAEAERATKPAPAASPDAAPDSAGGVGAGSAPGLAANHPAPGSRRAATLGPVLALLLLSAALLFVYGPWGARNGSPASALAAADPTLVYVADLDFWQRTPRESSVLATAHFDLDHSLADVPLQVGDWTGEVKPETNQEVLILLEPEQYEQRLYFHSDGFPLWLSMVGGRSSQPFHAPDICYDADGWQYSLGSWPVALAEGDDLWGLYLTAHKDQPDPNHPGQSVRAEHVVFYFYLFPDEGRALEDGIVLFKLTSSLQGTVEQTLERHADFVRHFFTQAAANGEAALPAAPPAPLAAVLWPR